MFPFFSIMFTLSGSALCAVLSFVSSFTIKSRSTSTPTPINHKCQYQDMTRSIRKKKKATRSTGGPRKVVRKQIKIGRRCLKFVSLSNSKLNVQPGIQTVISWEMYNQQHRIQTTTLMLQVLWRSIESVLKCIEMEARNLSRWHSHTHHHGMDLFIEINPLNNSPTLPTFSSSANSLEIPNSFS